MSSQPQIDTQIAMKACQSNAAAARSTFLEESKKFSLESEKALKYSNQLNADIVKLEKQIMVHQTKYDRAVF